ncbi:g13168 [Coccomyxa viridis]|uniref:Inositol polyphosphate multikinase n=1 Tax=Coccomyxa viridis TaxID=1274662 RepID=A0ABP1GGT4_9CHLO
MSQGDVGRAEKLLLKPCKHQVAGHLFEEGKAGSLVDDSGHFYKPLQTGPRGQREWKFYETVQHEKQAAAATSSTVGTGDQNGNSSAPTPSRHSSSNGVVSQQCSPGQEPFCERNAVLLSFIPTYYGVIDLRGRHLVELEDVAQQYHRPSIIDIKVGFQTWYPGAEEAYIQRCQAKDAATTQAALGFKICGMQVYRACQMGYWRASKRWCKQLPSETVNKALAIFANNEAGLRPSDIYAGPSGAIAQLQQLAAWFQVQQDFCFYSSSVLIIYEGDAETAEEANVSVCLVDFAHTFPSGGQRDANFIKGLSALMSTLSVVACSGQYLGLL